MADVLITPASGKVEFKDATNNIDGKIELDGNDNLTITAPGGDLVLGDTTSDVYIGNGINNIDIVFEQNGEIRGTAGTTLTLGSVGSNITMGTDLNINGNDITNAATINGSITSNWDNAYDNYITGITVTGTSTKTITLTQRDGGTLTANFTDIDTNTNTTYTAGKGLTLTGTTFDANVHTTTQPVAANTVSANTSRTYAIQVDDSDNLVVNVPWSDTNTTYSTATSTTLGLVKIGYSENGQNYPVELSNGQMYVNVPWTDTNTNNYVSAISFNGSGTLTATRSGLGDLTASLASGDITGPLGYTPYQEDTALSATSGTFSGTVSVKDGTTTNILLVHDTGVVSGTGAFNAAGYKISNTEIVDASRNLNNIESVNLDYGKRIYFGNSTSGTASMRYDNFTTAPNYFIFSFANGTTSNPAGVIYSLNGKNLLINNGLDVKITLNGDTGAGTFTGDVTGASLKTGNWTIDQNASGDLEFVYA